MTRNIPIPFQYSLIKRGKTVLLLREQYKHVLLEQGIEDLQAFLKKHRHTSTYLGGRSLHPSILLKDGNRMVIRHYLHGGLFRSLTRDLYLVGSRAFQELALTEEIIRSGIPTIQPIGAIQRFISPLFYKAYLLSLEVPQAMDLIQYLHKMGRRPSGENLLRKRKTIQSAGLLLRQFHQAGFFHGDLQLKNMIVTGDRLLLIDFDHSYQKETLSYGERMKNLLRLNRSVEKWRRLGLPITRADRLRFFLAYAGDDAKIREAMQKVFSTYSMRSFVYRLGWFLEGILNKNKELSSSG